MLVRKIRVDRLSNYNLRYPKRSYYHKSDYLILYRYEGQTENFDYSPKNTHIVTADNISPRTHFIKTNFFFNTFCIRLLLEIKLDSGGLRTKVTI